MKRRLREIMQTSCANRTLVAVHIERIFDPACEAGVILALGRGRYVLARISNAGLPNGIVVGLLRNVARVDTDTRQLRATRLLAYERGQWQAWLEGVFACEPASSEVGPPTLVQSELLRAKAAKEIVTICGDMRDIGFTGFVLDVSGACADLLAVTEEGEEYGHSRIRLDFIERLTRGGRSGENLKILYLSRNPLYRSPQGAEPGHAARRAP